MIHKFSLFGKHIAVDVNSGSVHEFDDVAFDVLGLIEHFGIDDITNKLSDKYQAQHIHHAFEEIRGLINSELLFSPEISCAIDTLYKHRHVTKALCLNVSHDCNLRCKYCFASTGSFGGARMNMDVETAKKAVDFLIQHSKDRVNLEMDFFGGEPLLNFDVVKFTIDYAKTTAPKYGKKFRFTMTTNATLLDSETIDYIDKNIDGLVLSLDGRPETNDNMRLNIDKSGSYNEILSKIKNVASVISPDRFYIRGTYTKNNLDFSDDVMHLANLGFKQISVEPMVGHENSSYAITEVDLPVIFEEYEKLAKLYVDANREGQKFTFFHFVLDSKKSPCLAKKIKGCGSGFEYVAVDPLGDIYPCHQFVGTKKFKMGNVFDNTLDQDMANTFKFSNVYTKTECANCWNKFYCSGGCAANAYNSNNNIDIPNKVACELQKKRTECALWIKTQLSD